MEKKIIEIKVKDSDVEFIEALFYEYRAKQDIINSIFDIHKFDDDPVIINSVPFKAYETQFGESKVKYDEGMKLIQDTYISKELQESGCKWEVDFTNNKLRITTI